MQLTPHQTEFLKLWHEFHSTGRTRPRLFYKGTLQAVSVVALICGLAVLEFKLGFYTLGGALLGFAFGLLFLSVTRWISFGRVSWPVMNEIVDWARVDVLLDEVTPDPTS